MRWKIETTPEFGSEKIISKFLLLPLCIDNEYRWLEYATYLCRYWDYEFGWVSITWLNK